MTKRQIRKKAYAAIFKEGKSHDDVYTEMRSVGKAEVPPSEVAKILASIPSRAIHKHWKPLWVTYIALMGIFIVLRMLGIYVLTETAGIQLTPPLLILAIGLGLVVPVVAIYAVVTGRLNILTPVGALLILSFFRGMKNGVQFNVELSIVGLLMLSLVFLSFFIPYRLKVPYTKGVEEVEVNGTLKKRLSVKFQDKGTQNDSVLDEGL